MASATDYCVEAIPACGPKNVGSFQQALNQAGSTANADRIFLGPGTYTAPLVTGFAYQNLGGPVEIVGAGQGGPNQTLLTSLAGSSEQVLSLMGGPGTSIHDLRIQLPENAAYSTTGLRTNGTARDISVGAHATQTHPLVGVVLSGGVLETSFVYIGAPNAYGVFFDAGGGTVRDSAVSADQGIVANDSGLVERTRVTAATSGVTAFAGQTTIRSSKIQPKSATATGLFVRPFPGFSATVIADGVDLIGPGVANTFGARAYTMAGAASSAKVTLTNSIIRGFAATLRASDGGSGPAEIVTSYSDYTPWQASASGPKGSITATHLSNVGDVGFKDLADGDYTLTPDSPLVDAGDPATAQGLDLLGSPLVTDGNLDGTARRDIGAFELPAPPPSATGDQSPAGGDQPSAGGENGPAADLRAPLVSAFASTRKVFAVGRAPTAVSAAVAHRTRLRYTLDEPARVTITIQRAVAGSRNGRYRTVGRLIRNSRQGSNSTAFSGRIGKRALRPGRYRAVARATDAAGNRSAPRRAGFRIAVR